MKRQFIFSVIYQQLASAYLMVQKYEPNLTVEEFLGAYSTILKGRSDDIKNVIKEIVSLSAKDKEKKKRK